MELFYILVALSGINISLFFERSPGDDYTLSELIGPSRLCNNGADMVVFLWSCCSLFINVDNVRLRVCVGGQVIANPLNASHKELCIDFILVGDTCST